MAVVSHHTHLHYNSEESVQNKHPMKIMSVKTLLLIAATAPSCWAWQLAPVAHPVAPPRLQRSRPCCACAPAPPQTDVVIDVAAQQVIDSIVVEELEALGKLGPEEQEQMLPSLMQRVETRAVEQIGSDKTNSYQFGDVTRAAVESVRGEVQRQMQAEWTGDDIALLLKVGIFLGAGAAAPVAGIAALPAAALLTTYGTVLKAELGVRAVQEVGTRMAERAAQGVVDGVKTYTGKDEYHFGDLTEATMKRITGDDNYKFGDLTKGAIKSMTGKDEYKFGDITRSFLKAWKAGSEKPEDKRNEDK